MIAPRLSIDLNMHYGVQRIVYFDRPGRGVPVLFVHGLGNAAANFDEMLLQQVLANHRLIALDLPGCGQSSYPLEYSLDIEALVIIIERFVDQLGLEKYLLVGASMGGLVALLYAERHPERLVGFLNVEGNLAPEDCMFSRLVVKHTFEEFDKVIFPRIKRDLQTKSGRGFAKHLEVLATANPRAYYDFSFQTVEYSDNGRLFNRFLELPIPQHFVYGSNNRGLTYLPQLRQSSCTLTEINGADHFLFYDAPEDFARCVRDSSQSTGRTCVCTTTTRHDSNR
jgi:pimeloyl-ACP methyl ester carboxylesterase